MEYIVTKNGRFLTFYGMADILGLDNAIAAPFFTDSLELAYSFSTEAEAMRYALSVGADVSTRQIEQGYITK